MAHVASAPLDPAGSFGEELWYNIGISPAGALGVFLATVVMYCFFTMLLSIAGPRLNARPTIVTIGVTLLLGAITARAMLGNSPTLFGGLIVLNTLMALELIFRQVQRNLHLKRFAPQAIVVVIEGTPVSTALHKRALSKQLLLVRLRQAGIHHLHDVALAILEPRGELTIIRTGNSIDQAMLQDVSGADQIPSHLVQRETQR